MQYVDIFLQTVEGRLRQLPVLAYLLALLCEVIALCLRAFSLDTSLRLALLPATQVVAILDDISLHLGELPPFHSDELKRGKHLLKCRETPCTIFDLLCLVEDGMDFTQCLFDECIITLPLVPVFSFDLECGQSSQPC